VPARTALRITHILVVWLIQAVRTTYHSMVAWVLGDQARLRHTTQTPTMVARKAFRSCTWVYDQI
jgi:hypothetical protein